jgi:serine/threonine protein kinase
MISDLPLEQSRFGPGSRIGKYVLEQQIGNGGMAVVFTARDDRLGRLVALKIMAPSVASDAEFRQRFVRESKAAAGLSSATPLNCTARPASGGRRTRASGSRW